MRRAVQAVLVTLLLGSVAACGPTTSQSGVARSGSAPITADEIAGTGHTDAYALIQALRPQWLRVRGAGSVSGAAGQIQVYLDGSHMGGTSMLRQISTQSVGRIEYLDGLEATQRWGLDHGNGAIVVSSRGR
ncbi:MAG TPA: hypothetical protein VFZ69_09515 [Longimicrobiales bacterium]